MFADAIKIIKREVCVDARRPEKGCKGFLLHSQPRAFSRRHEAQANGCMQHFEDGRELLRINEFGIHARVASRAHPKSNYAEARD